MSQQTYKPVPDGVYDFDEGQYIIRGNAVNGGLLPDNWRVCEAVTDPDALAVPDEIVAIIRRWRNMTEKRAQARLDTAADFIGRMVLAEVAQVDSWLDALSKENIGIE